MVVQCLENKAIIVCNKCRIELKVIENKELSCSMWGEEHLCQDCKNKVKVI